MPYDGLSKTRLLTPPEVRRLREQVAARYFVRNPGRKAVEPRTYLGAYGELHRDILRLLPDEAPSVSLHRLRKLFYYTDPTVCPPKQQEAPSFGRDFLAVLEQYVAEEEPEPAAETPARAEEANDDVSMPARPHWYWLIPAAFLLLVAALVMVVSRDPDGDDVWRDDFTNTSLDTIEAHGWELWDFDPHWWHCQDEPGMLALHTLPGDYYVKAGEPRLIPNVLVRPLPKGPVSVTAKIVGFHPTGFHQQVGFLLLKADEDRLQHLRSSIGYDPLHEWQIQRPDNQAIANLTVISIHINEMGEVYSQLLIAHEIKPDDDFATADPLFLRVELRDQKIKIWRKHLHDWATFLPSLPSFEMELSFTPAYIALAAFQGLTDDQGRPKGAQILPAYIDWVEVRRLE